MMSSTMNILKTILFSELNVWDVKRYLVIEKYSSNYPLIYLSDILEEENDFHNIENDKEYKLCGISAYGKGLFHREIKKGKLIKGKKLNRIKKGQFIYSRLGANNGAFDIVTKEFDGYWVTNEFPTFNISRQINPLYLKTLFSLKFYWNIISNKLQGAAHKRFKEKHLLNLKIPLPPLNEQNRLVENYKAKIKLAEQQEAKAKELEQEIENYLFEVLGIEKLEEKEIKKGLRFVRFKDVNIWGVDKLSYGNMKQILKSNKYENIKLKEVVYINPKTDLSQLNDDFEMSFIPMKYISDDYGEVVNMDIGKKANSKRNYIYRTERRQYQG